MKLFILLFILCFSNCFSQSPMKKNELSKDYTLIHLEDGGNKLLSKYNGVSLAFYEKKNELFMYGEIDNQTIIFLEKIPYTGNLYINQFISANYENGKISVCSRVYNKATINCSIFNWKNESMIYEKDEMSDLSLIQTNRAQELVKQGKINEALITYDSVMYSYQYYDSVKVGIELLIGGGKIAEELALKRKFKESVILIKNILNFKGLSFLNNLKNKAQLNEKFGKNLHGLTTTQFEKIILSHCQNLNDAKLFDEAIQQSIKFKNIFPDNSEFILQLANAYYGKKDKKNASENYMLYIENMKVKKKEKDIPYYVQQRLSN